uniref:integrator complex subunit 2-like n=1 Tax=Styela clava TaxID=7725 RepID=UPI00193A0EC9|nr:integrator complex subunit 2-like [Styela clava]
MLANIAPEILEAYANLDINTLLQNPVSSIRPLLPSLSRMLLCSSLDKTWRWEENQKDLMQLLSGIEDVNDIVALLSVDFHALEIDAKTEQKTRQKITTGGRSLITSNLQKHGLILEFERSEPARKLRLLISDIMPLLVAFSNSGEGSKSLVLDDDGFATKSELFSCIAYLQVVSDVLCIAVAELPTLLNILDMAEALMYVPNGGKVLCKLLANNPASILPVCQCIIKNHTMNDISQSKSSMKCIEERRKSCIEMICSMKPDIASNIRALTVQYCKLPSLAISLTLNHIMGSYTMSDGRVSELVTFVSGLLLGSNAKIRSWFASYIKSSQDIHPNYLRKELEKELRTIVVSSQIMNESTLDSSLRQDSMMEDDLIDTTMCILNEEQCLRATTLIRLCCALKAIAGLKFSEVESDLVLRLITCFPPLTAAGIRFMSLSLSMLLACSALIVDQDKEKRSINWIKWLASRSSELQNAGPEGGSFAEQLLLMAIHLHSDQRHAVAELACSTLGMRIKVPTSSLTRMRQIFTEEVFTTQVVAAHAVNVPVTKSLNATMTGYLPLHCVYQLLKSRAFSKSRVSIKEWIYKQICTTSSPLHPQLPSLIRQYVSTVVTPHTKGHDKGMLNNPLTEEEIMSIFSDKITLDGSTATSPDSTQEPSLTSQLLILYYVLLYEDSVLNHMKTLVTLPSGPKRYPSSLINNIPVKLLLHRAQLEPQSCDRLYPALLGLLATHLPHLCQVEDWISELDVTSSMSIETGQPELGKTKSSFSPDLLYKGLLHADVNPALALMHLRTLTSTKFSTQLTIPYAEPLTKGLWKLLEEDVSRRVKQEACKLWLKLNSVIPCKLWVLTCNELRSNPSRGSEFKLKQQDITLDNLVEDPLTILSLDDRVFRGPEILSIVLRMVSACLAASRVHYSALVKSNPTIPPVTTPAIPSRSDTPTSFAPPVSDNEKEELCYALVSAQDSAAIQILIEACLPTAKDWEVAGTIGVTRKGEEIPGNLLTSLREIHCLICSTLHQMFIANPKVAKLVHFQGYPSELIPVFVGGVPSMHICLDFIPELLQQQNIGKQLFAIQLASHLSTHYPLPKSLSIARLCVNVLSTLVSVLPAHQRCEFFSLALTSLRRFSSAFPPLLRNCISILLHLSRISHCHLASHDSSVPNEVDTDDRDENNVEENSEVRPSDEHAKLYRDVRKMFNHIVMDALAKY